LSGYSISEIIEYVNENGLLSLFKAGVKRFVFRRDKEILLSLSLEDPIPEIQPLHLITIRKAILADVGELHQSTMEHNWWRSKKQISEWIAKGYPFFLAIAEDKIVGYACVSLEVSLRDPTFIKEIIKAIHFEDDDAWGADAFVLPTHQGSRIYPALATETMKCAKAAGYRRILATVSPNNFPARSAHKKIGYKETKEITLSKIFFFKRTKIKSLKEEDILYG
jgi:GNAT superfamily N-acetyltransferase